MVGYLMRVSSTNITAELTKHVIDRFGNSSMDMMVREKKESIQQATSNTDAVYNRIIQLLNTGKWEIYAGRSLILKTDVVKLIIHVKKIGNPVRDHHVEVNGEDLHFLTPFQEDHIIYYATIMWNKINEARKEDEAKTILMTLEKL